MSVNIFIDGSHVYCTRKRTTTTAGVRLLKEKSTRGKCCGLSRVYWASLCSYSWRLGCLFKDNTLNTQHTSVYFQYGSQEAGLIKYDKYTVHVKMNSRSIKTHDKKYTISTKSTHLERLSLRRHCTMFRTDLRRLSPNGMMWPLRKSRSSSSLLRIRGVRRGWWRTWRTAVPIHILTVQ